MERPDITIGCEMAQASEEGYKKLRARAAASGGHLLMSSHLRVPGRLVSWTCTSPGRRRPSCMHPSP